MPSLGWQELIIVLIIVVIIFGAGKLPEIVRAFEKFKTGASLEVPDVPFQMLTALPISTRQWSAIARNAPWGAPSVND